MIAVPPRHAWIVASVLAWLLACVHRDNIRTSAVTALNVTDAAVAASLTAADALDPNVDLTPWKAREQAMLRAKAAIEAGDDICRALPDLRYAAVSVGCNACIDAVEAIPCPK